MEFEYDPAKSRANKCKHGIDFEEAQWLWDDSRAIRIRLRYPREDRYLVIGSIGDKCWSAVITYRQFRVRIISVRHSRSEEIAEYENR